MAIRWARRSTGPLAPFHDSQTAALALLALVWLAAPSAARAQLRHPAHRRARSGALRDAALPRAARRSLLRERARLPSPDLRLDALGAGGDPAPRFLRSRQRRRLERALELRAGRGGALQLRLRHHPRQRAHQLDAQSRTGPRHGERHGRRARPRGAAVVSRQGLSQPGAAAVDGLELPHLAAPSLRAGTTRARRVHRDLDRRRDGPRTGGYDEMAFRAMVTTAPTPTTSSASNRRDHGDFQSAQRLPLRHALHLVPGAPARPR